MRRSLVVGLIGATMALRAPCQLAWVSLPSPPVFHLSYDIARDVVVALGATATEEFDGVAWRTVPTLSYPNPTHQLATAYDKIRQRTVLIDATTSQTWEWDGVDWSQVGPGPIPLQLMWTHLTYDDSRGRLVTLQPSTATPYDSSQLMEWDGASWNVVPTINFNAPPTSASPGMWNLGYGTPVYDAALQKLVVFGQGRYIGTVAVFTASSWEIGIDNIWASYPPSGTVGPGASWFDQHRGKFLRYFWSSSPGAIQVLQREQNRTWATVAFTGIPPSLSTGQCYDPTRRRSYIYTTQGSIGYFTDTNPAFYEPHGTACQVATAPSLSLTHPWTLPWIGDSLGVDVTSVPTAIAMLAMGFSDTAYGSTQLPLDLTNFGMPACQWRVAPDATLLGVGANGAVSFQLGLPYMPSLVGTTFWQQALTLAPGVNPAGLLTSDSRRGVVGLPH